MRLLPVVTGIFLFLCSSAIASSFPLTVQSCGKPVTIAAPPQRAVVVDLNMAEMLFALGVQKRIAGLAGISGFHRVTPRFRAEQGSIPDLAPRYPSLETILAARADLFVAGWNYGMRVGGEVTPDALARFGIPTLVLTESCVIDGSVRRDPSMSLLYDDELRLGRVFGRQDRAQLLVDEWKKRIAAVRARIGTAKPETVFLYDSGDTAPFTAGRYALVNAMIEIAGGHNVFADLPTSWGQGSWERVVAADPDWIVLTDSGFGTDALAHHLRDDPVLRNLRAVRQNHLLPLRYDSLTPGPEDIEAIEALADALHPSP